jgi:ankyrin repeat protein
MMPASGDHMDDHPIALQDINIHEECRNQGRSSIILPYIDLHPTPLARADEQGCLPLHSLLANKASSSIDMALMMIEKYPAAVKHQNRRSNIKHQLPLHIECKYQCRSAVISRCIQLYPRSLGKVDYDYNLPLHLLLKNGSSFIEDALLMIEKYPAAVQRKGVYGYLPLHIECMNQCRSVVILKCIELYPEALAKTAVGDYLPLHALLGNKSSTTEATLLMIEKHPAALQQRNTYGQLPLHIACRNRCRSTIISKCIELYPEALAMTDELGRLPLHIQLQSELSSVNDTLTMINKYPEALQHRDRDGNLPLHLECRHQCRALIVSKCIELYPGSLNTLAFSYVMKKVNKSNLHTHVSVLSIIFTARPMSVYDRDTYAEDDIRAEPDYRRRILNLLPRHVFTLTHDVDYRDLNWKPRAAMMMLLSQILIQHSSKAQSRQ